MPRKPNRVRIAVLGLLAFFCMLVACWFYFARPTVGQGPAGPRVPRDPFLRSWSEKSVVVVDLGDSITAGFGARKGYSYFDRLINNPPDEFDEMRRVCLSAVFPNIRATNLAVSGSTSAHVLEVQLPRLPVAGSNELGIVVLTTGGNDLIHNYGKSPPRELAMYGATFEQAKPWIENFERRLDAIIRQINAKFPGGCHIFIGDIYDPTDGAGNIQRVGLPAWPDGLKILDAYNRVIHRCAAAHTNVHLVRLHHAFLGHGINCRQFWRKHYDRKDPHYWFGDNIEDPNERGYDAIRRLFLIEMAKVSVD